MDNEKLTEIKKNLNYRKAIECFFNFKLKLVALKQRVVYICLQSK